ncbi:hypothetical protein IFM89_038233 [Coptis chinensis]|uniref:DUF4283 domain-containing protein n=1 Tax=Coptis chinensis TaxID=261450 RepID=A0A835I259_9MAGN|nr:hypothetical protein IFM89_038233 [Coptis chinensis]
MDLYELENPSIPYSEKQKQLNHASLNGNSDAASAQRVISNELLAERTGQRSIETSPSGRGNPTRKSYAAAAAKPKYGRSIDASSLPTPGMQGEYPTICLIEEEVDRGIQYCLKSLVRRLDLVKMDLNKVKALVVDKWALLGECLVTPLGKGYLMFKFDKEEDYTKVWEQGSWLFDSQSLGETEVVNSSQGKGLMEKPMTRNQKKKWRKKNRTANEEAPNSEIHPLMVEEHEPRQQEAERAEVNRSETDVVVEEADRQSQEVSESEGGNQTQAREDLGTASEVETAVGITLEPNPEVLGRSEPQVHRQEMIEVQMELNKGPNIEDGKERHNMEMDGNAENEQGDADGTSQNNSPAERNTGPQGNRFHALVEAEKILESGIWGEQMEKEEEQVKNKKGYKLMWQVQVLTPPSTRARISK